MPAVKMLAVAIAIFGLLTDTAWCDPKPGQEHRERINGMKDAVANIEKGIFKLKLAGPPDTAPQKAFFDLLKNECKFEVEVLSEPPTCFTGPYLKGYNAVMHLEIDHRFGEGTLARLQARAMEKK
jgi:hypothetical protein